MTSINETVWNYLPVLRSQAAALRLEVEEVAGATILDFGIQAAGGWQAGLELARLALGHRATVQLRSLPTGSDAVCPWQVEVMTDEPLLACLGCQYAGRQVLVGQYFAMGSGPMRLLLGGEEILANWHLQEIAPVAVGTLETRKRPTPEVIEWFRSRLPAGTPLALAVAPASSPAGTLQVVARALETALHQLHEAHFDLKTLRSGAGVAPLPPVHPDELQAIGRTNDAILYGAEVTLWVDTTDDTIKAIGPRVTSSASPDHGTRFAELFARYGDFYKIDKQLFAPAVVTFQNLRTGRSFRYGRLAWDVLQQSFGSAG